MEYSMRKVTLELLSTKTNSRTRFWNCVGEKTYTGKMMLGPSIGKSFCYYRDDGAYSHTSTVKNIEYVSSNELKLTTLNSIYKLTIGESFNE